jgi:hypothetical protein
MVVVEHEEPRESPQVSVEVEIERQDFTERRGEEILAVDRRREIEIEIEIEVETETPQGQVNRQEAEEEPRWSPVKPGEPIKSEMTTGDAW